MFERNNLFLYQKQNIMDGKSLYILSDKLSKLKEIIPEAFTDDKVDWEKLKAVLGEDINFENERYNLNWAGKSDVFRVLQQRTSATLKLVQEESVKYNGTENVFIEGENLEVLKVLQKSYFGKIKMIYNDPPYNTGNDSFIYPDKFSESKEEYLKRIGDKSEDGYLLKKGFFRKNSKDGGHYHSNWLSMMYPRLYIARNLLRDDGVIFVSIDDNEVHNLRMIMNEIFGEENFIAQLVWNLRSGSQAGHFTGSHEYILSFAKSKESLKYFSDSNGGTIKHGALKKISKDNPLSDITFPTGIEFEGDNAEFKGVLGGSEKEYIRNDIMTFKNGKLNEPVTIGAGWAMRNQIISWINGEETYDSKGQKVLKLYFNSQGILWYEKERGTIHPKTVLPEEVGITKTGSDEIIKLFDKKLMDFPKPFQLIKFLIEVVCEKDDSVLDFFAGSGTTAQAVLELNKEDGGNRKFILVQLPEKTDENSEAYKAGYKTIADICQERIRRVIKKLDETKNEKRETNEENQTELELSKGEGSSESSEMLKKNLKQAQIDTDVCFRVFKLSPSNFKHWRSDIIESEDDLNKMVELFDTQLKPEAKEINMLYELMLKSGYTLTDKIELKKGFYLISEKLAVVLSKIEQSVIDEILKVKPLTCIILDNLFAENDQLKTNTALQMKDAGIELITI